MQRGIAVPAAAAAAAFVLAIVVSIAIVWLQPHAVEPAPSDAPAGHAVSNAPGQSATYDGAERAGSARSEAKLYVHVVGEVVAPGVYALDAGSRVLAAIEAASGPTEQAVLSALNLARPLTDGEQIAVPNAEAASSLPTPGGSGANAGPAGSGDETARSGLVNLNTADHLALETLPRVGPSLAQRIIEWREANGGFESSEQLKGISGIGPKTFEQLQPLVTV